MGKIILVGNGDVGSSYSFALVAQGIGQEIGIIDLDEKKVQGDVQDLVHGLAFIGPKSIYAARYTDCHDADLVVITAGAAQKPNETRLDLIKKNAAIMKEIVSQVMSSGFDGIFLIASNPVDVLTHYVRKLTGLPKHRVIGSGTSLDTARLRNSIGEKVGVDPRDVQVYVLGEHGDSQFPVWSHANIGGLQLNEWSALHPEVSKVEFNEIAESVKNAAYEIIEAKGSTHYGIAIALARITKAIIHDENAVLPVSVHLAGEYGYHNVCIGSPAIINQAGVKEIIEFPLSIEEKALMKASIEQLKEMQGGLSK
ncbi:MULTISPECIES: L-lactate dehydrogenase [unclassified Enterococcus]|uniref:L-lactate dehydrogenase n=1 Tax=unclassified Enterococcus TaxID=2608891 RepID=UPI0015572719|nr:MULTISPECIES: L-lactate dehydrogenase [unclassified Enterococcus]MBS7578240.1 L-lactate dehydrogenase [Enterococcus sp. MMGLQ5-2]MBS7585521.1 L-lactate dehydrogenase [Enterococcus sp. MMGLQ5-1]NPD13380.1 L-lactate dehydrogenase [Enterococcus sp. MMGLQ5-1]NPD38071.1 L-lactate dehydrogenase [Enterococcus sp. MMGLQ5-2]